MMQVSFCNCEIKVKSIFKYANRNLQFLPYKLRWQLSQKAENVFMAGADHFKTDSDSVSKTVLHYDSTKKDSMV